MPLCSPFTQRIAEFEVTLLQTRELLREYAKSGQPELFVQIKDQLTRLHKSREAFIKGEYFEAVKKIIERWMPSLTDHEQIPYPFELDEAGRIVWKAEMFEGELSRYFPHLIHTVKGELNISHTDIEELDFLEEVAGDFLPGPATHSITRLKRIGGALFTYETNPRITFPALEEIEEYAVLPLNIEDFPESFPRLRNVGQFDGISFFMSYTEEKKHDHEVLLKQIKDLKASGKLHFRGEFHIAER